MQYVLIILFAVLCPVAACYFIKAMEAEEHLKATFLKGLATVCCIGIAGVTLFLTKNHRFAVLVVLGLFFGFVGDELLALRFVYPDSFSSLFLGGAGSFFLGHVFYVIALYGIAADAWIIALPLTALCLVLELVNSKRHSLDMGKLFIPLGIYCAFVCFMGCSAVGAAFENFSVGTLLFAVAGVCFIISDSILSVQCFSDHPDNRKNRLLHVFYWAAQLLIALSPLFIA